MKQIRQQVVKTASGSRAQPGLSDGESMDLLGAAVQASDATLYAYADFREAFLSQASEAQLTVRTLDSRGPTLEPGAPLTEQSLIRGVGLGLGSEATSSVPGEPVVRLYTSEVMSSEEATSYAAGIYGVQSLTAAKVGVEAVLTGTIDAYAHRHRWRPTCPGGISVGHIDVSAGTLGAYCRGRSGDRQERSLILSNNHILANTNDAEFGDDILQQAQADGGLNHDDVIGYLEDYVAIDFSSPNQVDAATAWVDREFVDTRFLYVSRGQPSFFNCLVPTMGAHVGMHVGKSGRTTGLTGGFVAAVGATITVDMGRGRLVQYIDQIEIRGASGAFSQPGDSGSLIWTWDRQRQPVGLLFSGGGRSTFANPIDTVLDSLDIEFQF